jgi:hypothetical protein
MSKEDKEGKGDDFKYIGHEVIIIKPTIYEQIEEDKRRAIKRIMAIVDTQVDNGTIHGHIRKSVLDALNDMARAYCLVLDRLIEKYDNPTYQPHISKPEKLEINTANDLG